MLCFEIPGDTLVIKITFGSQEQEKKGKITQRAAIYYYFTIKVGNMIAIKIIALAVAYRKNIYNNIVKCFTSSLD